LDWTSADKHALLWASRGRWVPARTPTEIGGASGGASTAIVAVMNWRPAMKPHISKSSRAAAQKAKSRRPVVKRSRPKAERARVPVAAAATAANQKHPTGKLGRVLNAVAATRGASLDELVELTGWQPHTARAALTRLRQRGFAVDLRETADRKAYHLAEAVSQ
jgi:hypothetical protein